ncbi:MAG: 4Fe-4S ferredoxin [Deltaproteobacteria bacterium]|nr:MAG: 4Fe-4S ferredoxin [Deltaproteobacteria bacterium]RLC15435.1 MAG: 4Fe-4S ferredoxin [Deltaproteobacteria bacterium]
MTESIYRQLQQRLDLYSMGFPAAKSGIEIKILRYLFSENNAHMFLALTHNLATTSSIATNLNRSESEVSAQLEEMTEKGLVFRVKKGDSARYAAIPFVHGLFEFQVKNIKPELARMVEDYFDEAFDKTMLENAEYFLRTIPVNQSIDVTRQVATYDDAIEILKTKPHIVVTDCICRKSKTVIGEGCGKTMEACFMFGSMGQYYLDKDIGREVSLAEATAILENCRDAGLVTQPATSQNPTGMCNCCGDCCGVLKALNKHPKPAEMVFSNHLAMVESDECTGCEQCLERCQMDAIFMNDDELAQVNPDRCIGCGLCVTTCPTEAIKLAPKSEATLRLPPVNTAEQMLMMAQKRGVI